jgi:hypothetical protein
MAVFGRRTPGPQRIFILRFIQLAEKQQQFRVTATFSDMSVQDLTSVLASSRSSAEVNS